MDYVQSRFSYDVKKTATIKDWITVIKPMIVLGNMMTATAGYLLASRGQVDPVKLWEAVTGIALMVAAACVVNNYIDKDLDRKMVRTRHRVLAERRLPALFVIGYAAVLAMAGLILMQIGANLLALSMVLAGWFVYVGLYSICLKPRSVHATWIGSLAGAAPPMAGYCAAGNCFDSGALLLLLIFCFWQVPHSYAIAVFRSDDYHAARIPALPIKLGLQTAKRHIMAFIAAFTVATALLTVTGYTGYLFLAATCAMGLIWLLVARQGFTIHDCKAWGERLFIYSILELVVLSAMLSIEGLAAAA